MPYEGLKWWERIEVWVKSKTKHHATRWKWFDKRNYTKWLWQRLTRGFDDTETWGLDTTISQFVLPRLKRFKEINIVADSELDGKWNEVLDDMIYAHEVIAANTLDQDSVDWERVLRGLELFGKHYRTLWW